MEIEKHERDRVHGRVIYRKIPDGEYFFIRADYIFGLQENAFAHCNDVHCSQLMVDDRVTFTLEHRDGKTKARNVQLEEM